jgi:hypothetical protein
MTSSTGLPSTRKTELQAAEARPGAAGAAPGRAAARAALAHLFGRGPEVPPALGLPRRAWLLAPACGVVVALCAVLAAWHAAPRRDPAGFDLRAGGDSSNVDSNSAGADGAVPAAPPAPSLDRPPRAREVSEEPQFIIGPVRPESVGATPPPAAPPAAGGSQADPVLPPLPMPTSRPELPPLPPAPPLPDLPASDRGPPPAKPDESHRDLQRGDSTMRQLNMLGLPVALAAALSAQSLASAWPAGDPPTPTLEQTAKDLKELKEAQQKSAEALMQQLKIIQEQLKSVEGLRKDIDGLKDSVQNINRELSLSAQMHNATANELRDTQARLKKATDELELARAQVGRMEEEVRRQAAQGEGLRNELAQVKKANGARESARVNEGTGTIRLFNTYDLPVTVNVNRRGYYLDPGASAILANQPLGTFTYEVVGISPQQTRTLTADRPFDIEVYDQNRGTMRVARQPR